MEMHIADDSWVAEILFSPTSELENIMHCTATVRALTMEAAAAGTKFILHAFARGRRAFIRVAPEVSSHTDFATKKQRIQGFVRFSFSLESGEWKEPPPEHAGQLSIGLAETRT